LNTNTNYIIGIDASRCRSGGAIAHINGIISNLNPEYFNIKYVYIWAPSKLVNKLPNFPWLIKLTPVFLKKNIVLQLFWQLFILSNQLKKINADILFTADASSLCKYKKQVVLSQDLFSYEPGLMKKLNFNKEKIRLNCILWLQNLSFRRATGVIFLTNYAAEIIQSSCGKLNEYRIIPHGVDTFFRNIKRSNYKIISSINCLYISNTAIYKNQWNVVKALELLRNKGIDINLNLVGGGTGVGQILLEKQIAISDPNKNFVRQFDFLSQLELPNFLLKADIFIFASECEAFGITLLEAMASGIPIACSNRSCLPELLENAGVLFDPANPENIANSLELLIKNETLRENLAINAKFVSSKYSWSKCSESTFSYIIDLINKN
jgi:glycosyltransferase involved in cell wall biosynthesis